MTLEQLRKASALADARASLLKTGAALRMSDSTLTVSSERSDRYGIGSKLNLTFEKCGDALKALVRDEIAARVAEIDAELRAIGVEPDEFEGLAVG